MGVQFGICNCDGKPVDNDLLERVESLLIPYAPEGISVLRRESCALFYGSCENGVHSGTTATVSPAGSKLDDVGRPSR